MRGGASKKKPLFPQICGTYCGVRDLQGRHTKIIFPHLRLLQHGLSLTQNEKHTKYENRISFLRIYPKVAVNSNYEQK